jgi:adenosylmethionine-8-amino-7-oxononanoate aminotransferase
VERICRQHGVLTVADIVIGGFGRLGTWLAVERFDLTPDLIVFAKGVTSGYLPLGGVIAAPSIAEPFWSGAGSGATFAHGTTYAGHPTCCAAAIANLDLLGADGLVSRARDLESGFHQRLGQLSGHERVREVRGGVGLMAAVALEPDLLVSDPDVTQKLWSRARKAGLLTRWLRDGVALAPPLTIEDEHVEFAIDALESALDGLG